MAKPKPTTTFADLVVGTIWRLPDGKCALVHRLYWRGTSAFLYPEPFDDVADSGYYVVNDDGVIRFEGGRHSAYVQMDWTIAQLVPCTARKTRKISGGRRRGGG